MPPVNAVAFSTAMAVWVLPPLATILLRLSTLIPPTTVPVSRMPPPLRNAPLTTEMPPEPIVPVLVTPPLKVVALITMAGVLPPKTVGYGPVNAMEPPNALRPLIGSTGSASSSGGGTGRDVPRFV